MNIGIDMDDTICSTSKMIEVYSDKYIKENNITKDELWNVEENKENFLEKYLEKIYDESPLKEGVRECLDELKKLGYNIYIITARTENYVEDINNRITNYLKTNNLLVDGFFINSKDKVDVCKNKNIDLMIEDNLYNYTMLKQNNINAILLDEENKYEALENKVKNWYEVINIIRESRKDKMKELILPNYKNSIVNVACSIRKYFELDYNHNTMDKIDKILEEKQPKNVVVILFDGMGSKLLKEKLPNNSFLVKNLVDEISSVVPSTTTASTTSMLSGLTPAEHNWLGWDLYVKEEDKIITMFTNTLKDTDIDAADYNVARKYFPYDTITDSINKNEKYYSKILFPFGEDSYENIDDMFIKIKQNINKKEKNYIYAYYDDPDGIMHDTGTDSNETLECFKIINKKVEELSQDIEDTLLIVLADHGHINCSPIILSDYEDIFNTLDGDVWIEGRMCAFKIKEGKENKFEELFNKYFQDDFILKTKEEVIDEKLFGDGIENNCFRDSLGDYFALAVGNKYFKYTKEGDYFKSAHAGFTIDEMQIPLIIINKK